MKVTFGAKTSIDLIPVGSKVEFSVVILTRLKHHVPSCCSIHEGIQGDSLTLI